MAYNYEYPYTDPNRFNVDWLLNAMKELRIDMSEFVNLNSIKWHDPLQWDITTQYERLTIVKDNNKAYLSKQPVPIGITITNEDYWQEIGDFDIDSDIIRENIAPSNEHNELIATENHLKDSLLWWKGNLYYALSDIASGSPIVTNVNVKQTTCEEYFNSKLNDIWNLFTTELVLNDLKVNGDTEVEDVTVNGSIKYEEVSQLSEFFGTVPFVDKNGNSYELLAKTNNTEFLDSLGTNFTTPEKFGAKGDGSIDDSVAFQNCIDDANENNKIVLLKGTYRLENTIIMKDNVKIIGNESCKILDTISRPNVDTTFVDAAGYYPIFECNGLKNIYIEGVTIDGDTTLQGAFNYVSVFNIYECENVVIRNCNLHNCKASGGIMLEFCNNVWIEGCTFDYYKYVGVSILSSHYCYVRDCHFSDVGLDYINTYAVMISKHSPYATTEDPSYVYVLNNTFEYPNNTANWETIDAHCGYNLIVDGNIIKGCRNGIAMFSDSALGITSYNVTITNNIVMGGQLALPTATCCMIGGYNFTVSNNKFIGGGNVTLADSDVGPAQCGNMVITEFLWQSKIDNNYFAGGFCNDISIRSANGQNVDKLVISNNHFDGVNLKAVTQKHIAYSNITRIVDSLVVGNEFMSTSSARPIYFDDPHVAGSNVVFRNNIYRSQLPNWLGYTYTAPDLVSNPSSLNYGRVGCVCQVATPAVGADKFKVYNGTAWV